MGEPLKDALSYFVESLRGAGISDQQIAQRLRAAIPEDIAARICNQPNPGEIVSTTAAAEAAGVSRVTIHLWIKAGRLKVREQRGTRRYVRLGDVFDLKRRMRERARQERPRIRMRRSGLAL